MHSSEPKYGQDASRLARVLSIIDKQIVTIAAAIIVVLTVAFVIIYHLGAPKSPHTERVAWAAFCEGLIPNLIATFLLFVGSYVFLRELNRERKGADNQALAAVITSEVLKEMPRKVASEVMADMRDLQPVLGVPKCMSDRDAGLHDFLREAKEVWMAGKTLQMVLANHENLIVQKLSEGTKFRFLVPNPDDREVMTVLSRTSRMEQSEFVSSLKRSLGKLEDLQTTPGPGAIEIRLMDFVPYNGYTIVDPEDPHRARTFVDFFGLGIDLRERISTVVHITLDPKLYAYHRQQYSNLWKLSKCRQAQVAT